MKKEPIKAVKELLVNLTRPKTISRPMERVIHIHGAESTSSVCLCGQCRANVIKEELK